MTIYSAETLVHWNVGFYWNVENFCKYKNRNKNYKYSVFVLHISPKLNLCWTGELIKISEFLCNWIYQKLSSRAYW